MTLPTDISFSLINKRLFLERLRLVTAGAGNAGSVALRSHGVF